MWLFDPFSRLGRTGGAIVALGVVLGGLACSRMGVRFDGFLDLHVTGRPVPLRDALADQFVAVPLGVIVAWIVAFVFRARSEALDLLAAIGVPRVPCVLAAPLFATLLPEPMSPGTLVMSPALMVVAVLAMGIVAWQITLLVFGVRHATGLRGGRLAGAVVSLILIAEFLSKLALAVV